MKYKRMKFEEITRFDDRHMERFESIYARYKKMYLNPNNALPMFIINTPVKRHTWEEKIANPATMLEDDLLVIKAHADIGDDRVPAARVSFGTAQIAAAFGCELFFPTDNLPCAKTHVLEDIKNASKLMKPKKGAGWYEKFFYFSEFYMNNLPQGVQVQMPDIQSTFNNAHLIRGNDIIFDFYDNPSQLDVLLDKVTEYMIELVDEVKPYTTDPKEWFFDWGCLWKGRGRISNCSTHLISPQMYKNHVLKRDAHFIKSIGGGRIHYCGSYPQVIESFANMSGVTGFDYDDSLHSLEDICDLMPKNIPIFCWTNSKSKTINNLLSGKWPKKKNIIIGVNTDSQEEAKNLLKRLKEAALRNYEK